MRRPVIDAIMDGAPFCWVNEAPDSLLYNIWLRWQTRHMRELT